MTDHYLVDTIEREGYVAKIRAEEVIEDFNNPRQFECNLGTMVCWHPDYILGDEQIRGARGAVETVFETETGKTEFRSLEHVKRYLSLMRGAVGILPLYLYDHSGISIAVGRAGGHPFDSAGWDSSNVGWIYTTHERVAELCGDGAEYHTAEWIENALRAEVATYNQYLTGDIYWYSIEYRGEVIDSCGGFFGLDYATEEVNRVLDGYIADRDKEVAKAGQCWNYVRALAVQA